MPRRVATEDWDDNHDDEGFVPPEDEWEPDEDEYRQMKDDDDGTISCPYCGEPVYEGAERCPHCEKYISEEDAPLPAKKTWIVVTATVVMVLLIFFWVLRGL
jgi:hypothetical protein